MAVHAKVPPRLDAPVSRPDVLVVGAVPPLADGFFWRAEPALGASHPATLSARAGLAAILAASGRDKDAIAQYRQTLAGHELVHGPGHPETTSGCWPTASGPRAPATATP
jgi:tetratricopeptide repeat protein